MCRSLEIDRSIAYAVDEVYAEALEVDAPREKVGHAGAEGVAVR